MSASHCTIKDIAHTAQVSISTVSYALRNNPRTLPALAMTTSVGSDIARMAFVHEKLMLK